MPYADAERQRQARRESARRRRAAGRQDATGRPSAAAAPREAPVAGPPQMALTWPYTVQVMEFLVETLRRFPPGSFARLDILARTLAGRLQVPPAAILRLIVTVYSDRVRDGYYCSPFAAAR